jgi:hypothetical protein
MQHIFRSARLAYIEEETMPFEPQLPSWLEGTLSAAVRDPAGLKPSRTIIQIPDAWAVRVQWTVSGMLAGVVTESTTWHVRVYLESLGVGLEDEVGKADVLGNSVALSSSGERSYDITIPVPGNLVGLTAGAYKMVTVLTLDNGATPATPLPIAGYVEGPVLQFYQYP